ncbi:MAG: hypothetical protein EH224_15145 [Calditrichaeota bacterium]|nr:MAG: hypothetical protein EH224_15145 [Calditrichota bacterium]
MQIFDLFGSMRMEGDSQVESALGKLDEKLTDIGGKMMKFGGALTAGVTLPILGVIGKSTMLASDLNESFNVVNVTFQKNAGEVTEWSRNLLDRFGMVQLESLQYVGSMGAMMKSSGISAKAAQGMSQSLVELTGDMSSFYNLKHEETWEKIRAGISGETEPLKVLGINMSVANMEAFALQQGINKAWKEMSQSEQIMLRYQYLMSVTSDAQGDFARTSDGFANQLRILEGRLTEISIRIGEKVLPIVNDFTKIIVDLTERFTRLDPVIQNFVFAGGLIVAAIGPLIMILGGVVTGLGMFLSGITAITSPVIIVSGLIVGLVTGIGGLTIGIAALTLKSGKVDELKDSFQRFADVVKPIPELIMAIFTNDKDKMMDLLINKFNLSWQEADSFANKVQELKDKLDELANKVGTKVKEKLEELLTNIWENRHEIAQFIENIIQFGIDLLDFVDENGPAIKEFANDGVEALKGLVGVLETIIGLVKDAITLFQRYSYWSDKVVSEGSPLSIFAMPGSGAPKLRQNYASGTNFYPGGWSLVGEKGPELVSLPGGSRIHTAAESRSIMNQSNNSSNDTYNIYVTLDAKNVQDFNNVVDFIEGLKVEAVTRGSK